MGERKIGMSREEIAVWLEETASQLRTGNLMVDGESVAVSERPEAAIKTKSKDGRRRLKLQLQWQESSGKPSKKSGKKAKKDQKNVANGGSEPDANAPQSPQIEKQASGESTNDKKASGKRGNVRDYEAHVLVCKGGDCSKKGGKDTKKAFKNELRAEGMSRDVRMDSVDCLGMCKQGPNVIVYPEGAWYLGLKQGEVPEVVQEHLKGGEPVQRLAAERRPLKQKAKK